MFRAIKQHVKARYHEKKACHDTTKYIEQKSFTDHEPKRIRRYHDTHVNMASYDRFKHGRNNNK